MKEVMNMKEEKEELEILWETEAVPSIASFEEPEELDPEFIPLEAANMADLNCPGCKVSPIEE
jgi:hypothetical protein